MLYEFPPGKSEICSSINCVRYANEILNYIDEKLNPCDDFYQFSCGNYLKSSSFYDHLPKSTQDYRHYTNMLEEIPNIKDSHLTTVFKRFYNLCNNESNINSLGLWTMKQIIHNVGGWPVIEENYWNEQQFDFMNTTLRLHSMGVYSKLILNLTYTPLEEDETQTILNVGT